jgi:hypothetical protein
MGGKQYYRRVQSRQNSGQFESCCSALVRLSSTEFNVLHRSPRPFPPILGYHIANLILVRNQDSTKVSVTNKQKCRSPLKTLVNATGVANREAEEIGSLGALLFAGLQLSLVALPIGTLRAGVANEERNAFTWKNLQSDIAGVADRTDLNLVNSWLLGDAGSLVPCIGGIVFQEDARKVPLSRFRLHCGDRFR